MNSAVRNSTLDMVKGLALLLVVVGHSWFAASSAEMYRVIFSIHMPFFFFVSGMVLNASRSFYRFAFIRADSLLKPYFVVLAILLLIRTAKSGMNFSGPEFAARFGGIFWGTGASIQWVPLWFLTHLFLASVICWLLIRLARQSQAVLLIFAATLFSLGAWAANSTAFSTVGYEVFPVSGLPWSADLLPLSISFMLFGYFARAPFLAFHHSAVTFILAGSVFILLHLAFDDTIDFNLRAMGNPLVVLAQIAAGIYLMFSIGSIIASGRVGARIPRFLLALNQAAIFVLIFHLFFMDKTLSLLTSHRIPGLLAAGLSVAAGIGFPVLLSLAAKQVKLARWLMLPSVRAPAKAKA